MCFIYSFLIFCSMATHSYIFLIFDSGLKHGNKLNVENKTRLSFDFRVIPLSKRKPAKKGKVYKTLSRNLKFSLGDYYDLVKVNTKN